MSTLFIIDIDATISDATERIKRAGTEPSRENKEVYNAWVSLVNSGMEKDAPVPGMQEMITRLSCIYNIVYLTSREEKHRKITHNWLMLHDFPIYDTCLLMRPDVNYEEGPEWKVDQIDKMADGYEAVVVIDDDESGRLEQLCKERG